MYCTQCGTKLPDTAKFCSNCGFKLDSPAEVTLPVNTEAVSPEMPLPRVTKIYNDILEMSETVSQKFVSALGKTQEDLEEFLSVKLPDMRNLFGCTETYALDLLHEHKLYQYSAADVMPYTRKYMGETSEVLSKLLTAYAEIDGDSNAAYAYNQSLRDNHSYFVGGGFGLSGAVKGMALAGVLNSTVGIFDSYIANRNDRATRSNAQLQKSGLFNSSEFRGALMFAIELDIKEAIHGICDLFQAMNLPRIPFYPIDNLMQCSNILDSVFAGKVPQNEIECVAYQIINLYPVHRDVYFYAAKICPEQKELFFSSAEKYGIDIHAYLKKEVIPYAKNLINNKITMLLRENNVLERKWLPIFNFIDDEFHEFWSQDFGPCFGENSVYRSNRSFAHCRFDEIPILFLDISKYHTGEEGIVLTDQKVRFSVYTDRTHKVNSWVPYRQAAELSLKQRNNGYSISLYDDNLQETFEIPFSISSNEAALFVDLVRFFANYFTYIQNGGAMLPHGEGKFAEQLLSFAGATVQAKLPNSTDSQPQPTQSKPTARNRKTASKKQKPHNAEEIVSQFEQILLDARKNPSYYKKQALVLSAVDKTDRSLERDLRALRNIYSEAYEAGEKFLFYHDNTITGSCKESFLMTDKWFHCHSEKYDSWYVSYKDIESVRVEGTFWPYLTIDGDRIPITASEDELKEMADDFMNFFFPYLASLS